MAKSPVKGKYDQAIDSESAYEVLQGRMNSGHGRQPGEFVLRAWDATEASAPGGLGAVLAAIMALPACHFRHRPRARHAASTGQKIARQVTRSSPTVSRARSPPISGNRIGGNMGGSVGRAIVRGTMGGILRR